MQNHAMSLKRKTEKLSEPPGIHALVNNYLPTFRASRISLELSKNLDGSIMIGTTLDHVGPKGPLRDSRMKGVTVTTCGDQKLMIRFHDATAIEKGTEPE